MPVLSHRRLDLVREGDQLAQGIERRQQLPAAKRFAAEHPRAADTDPDLTAVSHEAERAPEPGSTDPNKGPSAAEAAAAEAEASRASLEQYLPEEDRAQLHEALARIDQEKARPRTY
jgi:hypothetical protein